MRVSINNPIVRNSKDLQLAIEKLNALLNMEITVEVDGVITSKSILEIAGETSVAKIKIPTKPDPDLSMYAMNDVIQLTWASTMTIDLASNPRTMIFTQTGATTLAFTNIAPGNTVSLLFKGSGYTLSFPAGVYVKNTTTTGIPSGLSRVDIACFGTTASTVYIRTYYS